MWPAMADAYGLRALTAADLPVMAQWLNTSTRRRWWGGPADKLALAMEVHPDPTSFS